VNLGGGGAEGVATCHFALHVEHYRIFVCYCCTNYFYWGHHQKLHELEENFSISMAWYARNLDSQHH
jgi:hypothetical protein